VSDKNLEQPRDIRFCVKIGKNAGKMLALLTLAYGEYVTKKSSVFEWHRLFEEGREDVQDDPGSGQPKTQRRDANVGALRIKIRCESDSRRIKYGNLFGGRRPELWPDKWILRHGNALHTML
jgi:hypothetical protein